MEIKRKGISLHHGCICELVLNGVVVMERDYITSGQLFKDEPMLAKNYTKGFEGDENHAWILHSYDLYEGNSKTIWRAMCYLHYEAANPEFIDKWLQKLNE